MDPAKPKEPLEKRLVTLSFQHHPVTFFRIVSKITIFWHHCGHKKSFGRLAEGIMDPFQDDEFVNYHDFSGNDDGESSIEDESNAKRGHMGGPKRSTKGEFPPFKSRLQASVDRKRQDRNQREQQRSFRITKQIDELKQLLISSGVKVRNVSGIFSCFIPPHNPFLNPTISA